MKCLCVSISFLSFYVRVHWLLHFYKIATSILIWKYIISVLHLLVNSFIYLNILTWLLIYMGLRKKGRKTKSSHLLICATNAYPSKGSASVQGRRQKLSIHLTGGWQALNYWSHSLLPSKFYPGRKLGSEVRAANKYQGLRGRKRESYLLKLKTLLSICFPRFLSLFNQRHYLYFLTVFRNIGRKENAIIFPFFKI